MGNKHFKLREDLSIEVCGVKLFRIEATRDIERPNVKTGDLGGYVEKERNLAGDAWVCGNACVYGNARVYGDAYVCGDARVYGNAHVFGGALVHGNAHVYGDARVWDNACVRGDAQVYGDAHLYGYAIVCGDKIKNTSEWRNIVNERYNITITPELLKIGCQCHTKEDWWNFTDSDIIRMGGKDGLKWWKKWKPILMAICDAESEVNNGSAKCEYCGKTYRKKKKAQRFCSTDCKDKWWNRWRAEDREYLHPQCEDNFNGEC